LRRTRLSLTSTGVAPPPNVRVAVTNFGGNSPGVTQGLRNKGLTFIDMNNAPTVPARPARVYVTRETIPEMAHDVSASVGAYNTRRDRVEAFAAAVASAAQIANDFALNSAIKRELAGLTEKIGETMVTKGGALVIVRVRASSPKGVQGAVVGRSVESAYVANLPPGLTRERAIELFYAQPSI